MNKLFIFIALLLSITTPVFAQEESINSFDSQIIIQKDGGINVIETIDYNFGSNQKHGIFRDIPVVIKNEDGKRFKLEIKNITVSDKFQTSTKGDNLEIKIGDANKLVSGEKTYKINYEVIGVLTYFSEHDELYWNVTGNDWQIPILKSTAEVILPENSLINKTICYTGLINSTSQNCQNKSLNNQAEFTA